MSLGWFCKRQSKVKEELEKREADLAAEVAKTRTLYDELAKKEEELLAKTTVNGQLRSLAKRYKDKDADNVAKLRKVKMIPWQRVGRVIVYE